MLVVLQGTNTRLAEARQAKWEVAIHSIGAPEEGGEFLSAFSDGRRSNASAAH